MNTRLAFTRRLTRWSSALIPPPPIRSEPDLKASQPMAWSSTPGRMAPGLGRPSECEQIWAACRVRIFFQFQNLDTRRVRLILGALLVHIVFSDRLHAIDALRASNDNNATPAGSLTNPFPGGILAPAGNRPERLPDWADKASRYTTRMRIRRACTCSHSTCSGN